MVFDPLVDTVGVTEEWVKATQEERAQRVADAVDGFGHSYDIAVVSVPTSGQIVLRITTNIEPAVRGIFLLQLEEFIKREVDEGVSIWLEPVGDRSKLRKLRGVIVKNSE